VCCMHVMMHARRRLCDTVRYAFRLIFASLVLPCAISSYSLLTGRRHGTHTLPYAGATLRTVGGLGAAVVLLPILLCCCCSHQASSPPAVIIIDLEACRNMTKPTEDTMYCTHLPIHYTPPHINTHTHTGVSGQAEVRPHPSPRLSSSSLPFASP